MKLLIITCANKTLYRYNLCPLKLSSRGKYIIVPILQMWKPRLREVKSLGPSHTARADEPGLPRQSVISGGHKGEKNEGDQSVYCYKAQPDHTSSSQMIPAKNGMISVVKLRPQTSACKGTP